LRFIKHFVDFKDIRECFFLSNLKRLRVAEKMTYNQYSPEQLDQLVLRIFDLAALLREISQNAKNANLDDIPMHDRKAILWCEQLEHWAAKTKVGVDILLLNRTGTDQT